jgi:phosphatidylserine decarboxylase
MSEFSWSDLPSDSAFPLASAGYPFIFASVFTTAVFALLGLVTLSLMGLAATFFICYFFRDPDRIIPNNAGCVVSPADGKVISAGLIDNSRFYEGSCIKVSIFMSIFNVHVNRIPHEGRIKKIQYYPGKFFSANLDKASSHNEHNAIFIETEGKKKICTVQIAGLIARRIICNLQMGDIVTRGQRFGLICFGSRLDVYLPAEINLKVVVGDKVKSGASVLGELI